MNPLLAVIVPSTSSVPVMFNVAGDEERGSCGVNLNVGVMLSIRVCGVNLNVGAMLLIRACGELLVGR